MSNRHYPSYKEQLAVRDLYNFKGRIHTELDKWLESPYIDINDTNLPCMRLDYIELKKIKDDIQRKEWIKLQLDNEYDH